MGGQRGPYGTGPWAVLPWFGRPVSAANKSGSGADATAIGSYWGRKRG